MDEYKWEVKTQYSLEHQEIIQSVVDNSGVDVIAGQILRLRDEGVRKALIEMGWTPPVENKEDLS